MKKSILVCLIIGLGLLVFGIVFLFVFPAKSSSSDSVDNSNLGDDLSAELETPPTPTSSISSNANIQLQASITKDVSFDEFQLSDYFYYQVGYLTKQNTIYIAIYNSGTSHLNWQQVIVSGQRNGENYLSCSYSSPVQLDSGDYIILKCDSDIILDQVTYGFAAY